MSRLKKFLYAYFSIILLMIVLSALGVETWAGDKTPIELFLTEWQSFVGLTLAVFVASLFL